VLNALIQENSDNQHQYRIKRTNRCKYTRPEIILNRSLSVVRHERTSRSFCARMHEATMAVVGNIRKLAPVTVAEVNEKSAAEPTPAATVPALPRPEPT